MSNVFGRLWFADCRGTLECPLTSQWPTRSNWFCQHRQSRSIKLRPNKTIAATAASGDSGLQYLAQVLRPIALDIAQSSLKSKAPMFSQYPWQFEGYPKHPTTFRDADLRDFAPSSFPRQARVDMERASSERAHAV